MSSTKDLLCMCFTNLLETEFVYYLLKADFVYVIWGNKETIAAVVLVSSVTSVSILFGQNGGVL